MKNILVILLIVLAGALAYLYSQTHKPVAPEPAVTSTQKSYTNEVFGYQFNYPDTWQAATNKFDPGNALFGPGATSESGNGGVELMGELKPGQSLSGFIREYNMGLESGSTSETEATINGQSVIVSILPGPSDRETKSVAFLNRVQVFNVYLGYRPAEKDGLAAGFDQILNSFQFSTDDQRVGFVPQFPNTDKNGLVIFPQKTGTELTVNQYFLSKPGFVVLHKIKDDSPSDVMGTSALLEAGLGRDLKIKAALKAGTYFALLYEDDGDKKFNIKKDKILPLYSSACNCYNEQFVTQFSVE
jgi:hypothetical protein